MNKSSDQIRSGFVLYGIHMAIQSRRALRGRSGLREWQRGGWWPGGHYGRGDAAPLVSAADLEGGLVPIAVDVLGWPIFHVVAMVPEDGVVGRW